MVDDIIRGSKGQQIGYRRGMEAFNLDDKKIFDIDLSGNLIDPITKTIKGHLRPTYTTTLSDSSLDRLFE